MSFLTSSFPIHDYLALIGVHFMALVSPGPDFALVIRTSLKQGKRAALACSVGITAGITIHVSYVTLGVSQMLEESPKLFLGMQIVCGLYLIFLGFPPQWKFWRRKVKKIDVDGNFILDDPIEVPKSIRSSFWTGFITNLLNAKAALFFLSIFSQFVSTHTPRFVVFIYAGSAILATLVWFSSLSLFLTHARVRKKIEHVQPLIEKMTGLLLMALGFRMISSVILLFI